MAVIMLLWNSKVSCARLKGSLLVFLVGATGILTYGQQKTLTVGDVPPAVSSKAFTTTPVVQLKKGEVRPANFIIGNGSQSVWDVRVHEFVTGGHKVRYPVLAIVNCSSSAADGNCSMVASTTVMTVDLKAGEEVYSDGYVLEATRAVKAGETVPTLLFIGKKGQSIMSIEAAPDAKDKGNSAKPQPWLTIFDERLKPSDRSQAVEAWRNSNATAASMLALPEMWKSDK